ncbi:unnamed protein product [Phaedon cochleariae]|uniref:Lysosomal acid phosphatase n=1 Tax=Phaedon cochleariae TaxID=80249 RepID=A0A9P0DPZ3_PHACE|nr:unnamed protein product [Phaedon cochleariae]
MIKLNIGIFVLMLLLLLLDIPYNTALPLQQLHVLFRHGERSPTETYPNDPYINHTWPDGWGYLTNTGKLQMYSLGMTIKNQYKHFIQDTYWPKDINISSSYSDRCKMSGQLFCAGMFPPTGEQIWNDDLLWQPIPINYLPRSEDITIAMKAKCGKYDEQLKEARVSPKILELEAAHHDLFEYLTKHTGKHISNIEDVEFLFNTLEIEGLNNMTLPDWVNQSMLATMEKLAARNLALYSETEYMKRMKGGVFVKTVISSMERISEGQSEPYLNLYAGHDITLVHVLRALKLTDTIKPGFGASLILELYSDGEIKVIYRNSWDGSPENMSLHHCSPPCQISAFRKSLESVLPLNWAEECNLE